ncbi:MAG: hypothetical protein GY822_28410, partial [Deltaproteobacteria bacterium]|nr:hypothetical protein [Deltaproteobacteria bacterium]
MLHRFRLIPFVFLLALPMGCPEPVGEGDAGEPSVTPEEDAGDVVGDDAGEPD